MTAMTRDRALRSCSTGLSTPPKRRTFGLRTFGDPGCPTDFAGAFRDNVRAFIMTCGVREGYSVRGMPVWCTLLVDERTGAGVPLYTVEEDVRTSPRPCCDYCRWSGWSHHFVSKRRYHFIIPSDEKWDAPLSHNCFDVHTHLLHGLIHCNGFGHLIVINGRDGGSKHVTGQDIMNLWDRICTTLRTREVTVEDSSRKGSMYLRLLHGVAYGRTWFGNWEYTFHRGSFGLTKQDYDSSIQLLASLNLDGLIGELDMIGKGKELRRIVKSHLKPYQPPTTLSQLLRALLQRSKPQPCKAGVKVGCKRAREFDDVASGLDSRWPARRLKGTAEVVVDALKEQGGVMTRQELRDAARKTIGDTGLLDFVIKSVGDCAVGDHVVRRRQNTSTRVLEFSLEGRAEEGEKCEVDLAWVYKHVLMRGKTGEIILNAKIWRKTWTLRDEDDFNLRFVCRWMPSITDIIELTRPLPPGEIVVVPPHAGVLELKQEAEKAMRDTYGVMEGLVVERLEGVRGEEWDPLFGAVESGATVWVSGHGVETSQMVKYEGGGDNWTVECRCGAIDDDGERMVACDVCEVWQHTKCAGIIDDHATIPRLFLCGKCAGTVIAMANKPSVQDHANAFFLRHHT